MRHAVPAQRVLHLALRQAVPLRRQLREGVLPRVHQQPPHRLVPRHERHDPQLRIPFTLIELQPSMQNIAWTCCWQVRDSVVQLFGKGVGCPPLPGSSLLTGPASR